MKDYAYVVNAPAPEHLDRWLGENGIFTGEFRAVYRTGWRRLRFHAFAELDRDILKSCVQYYVEAVYRAQDVRFVQGDAEKDYTDGRYIAFSVVFHVAPLAHPSDER